MILKVIFGAFVLFAMGCSTVQSAKQTVNINCNIPETILKVNGDRYDCPAQVQVRRDNKVLIEGYKVGYDKYMKEINYHMSTTGKLDAVGIAFTFFSGAGLLTPGAWDLDETEIHVILNKLE